MSKDDEAKWRIITGIFQYNDYLLNEQLVVKALNDEEKKEWFTNDMFDSYTKEIERLQEIISEALNMIEDARFNNLYAIDDILKPILNKLRESGIRNCILAERDFGIKSNEYTNARNALSEYHQKTFEELKGEDDE